MKVLTHALAPASLILALSATADAQCIGPDDFGTGPCCSTIVPNLPSAFPSIVNMQAQGDCWDSCGLTGMECLILDVSPPDSTGICGEYFAQFTVSDCSFTPAMSGLIDLTYMRTWDEIDSGGNPLQVWRFHAKIDMFGVSLAPPLCSIPPIASAGSSAFYYGYVDYAVDCVSGEWESAVVLFHNCDAFIHDQGISSTPGTWNPASTYAIVGPDTFANPFIPSINPVPPPGPTIGGAMREVSTTPFTCLAEERMTSGAWIPTVTGCLCPLSFTPAMNTTVRLEGETFCGSNYASLNFYPTLPWFDFVTTSIGMWSTDASYPGDEIVHVGEGITFQNHGCAANQTVDVMYGSITQQGYDVPAPLTQTFVDLASNYSQLVPGPYVPPFVGNVRGSRNLIYYNL